MNEKQSGVPAVRVRLKLPAQSSQNIQQRSFCPVHFLTAGIMWFNGKHFKPEGNLSPQMAGSQTPCHTDMISGTHICCRQNQLGRFQRNGRPKLRIDQGQLIIFLVCVRRDVTQLPLNRKRETPLFEVGTNLIQPGREQILNLKR